jgi:hypothetical protein
MLQRARQRVARPGDPIEAPEIARQHGLQPAGDQVGSHQRIMQAPGLRLPVAKGLGGVPATNG